MGNKKKVLVYLWSFSLGGGAEKILSTIVNHLDLEKYDVDILEIEHFDKGYEPVPEGVRILKPYKAKKHSRVVEALLWRARIWFPDLVRNHLVKDDYDIEISFTIMNPAFPFSKRPEVKKVAWIHGSIEEFLKPENAIYRENHRQHLKTANNIVAISKKTRESIETVYPEFKEKIVTIYNGYNFDEIIQKSNVPYEDIVEEDSIAVIGRLEAKKGTDRALEVFHKLLDIRPTAHIYFIGSGEQEAQLKERTAELGLEDRVHFLGYQKNPYPVLKRVKVLLSMSQQEGFSGAFVESLTLGKPFVSTDVGGAEELSGNGQFGTIIQTDEEAAAALNERMNASVDTEAMDAYIERFTVEAQMKQILEMLEREENEKIDN